MENGAAASRPRLAQALSDFVRRVQIPFSNTQMGKGAVTEFLPNAHAVAEEMSKVFKGANLSDAEVRQAALDAGMVLMRDDGARLVQAGVTSPEELLRVTRD